MLRIILFFLFPITLFAQTNTITFPKDISIDSSGKISICLTDSANETVYFECYRWNKWVYIDTIERKISDPDTCIFKPLENYGGEEQYRLEYKFHDGTITHSYVAKYMNDSYKDFCRGFAPGPDNGSRIVLNCPSKWEIYDQYGMLVRKGNSAIIPILGLPKGGYFLNYDNTTAEFFHQ